MTNDVIAVIGASNNPTKYGHRIFKDLLSAGYNVIPIHPTEKTILEQAVFATVTDMPTVPEIVIMVVPPAVTETVVRELIDAQLDIKEIWMQPGSESEIAAKLATAQGIKVHQACFMKAQSLW